MFDKFKKILLVTYRFLKKWRIYIGRNPRSVPPKSVIIFPVPVSTFFCGLAGILAIKKDVESKDETIDPLFPLFEEIKSHNLKKLLDGSIGPEEYMGGPDRLSLIEEGILGLKQVSTAERIFFKSGMSEKLRALSEDINSFILEEEGSMEENADRFSTADMEHINKALTLAKDCGWALEKDILSNLKTAIYLSGGEGSEGISIEDFAKYRNINALLNAVDRLEVRGRDSAGVQITFTLADRTGWNEAIKKLKVEGLYDDLVRRFKRGDLSNGSIDLQNEDGNGSVSVSFAYKRASISGKLGENTNCIRNSIRSDKILHALAGMNMRSEAYLAHTRWASVGSVTEENCHPVNNFTYTDNCGSAEPAPLLKEYPHYGKGIWSINVALNGDIDNYRSLRQSFEAEGAGVIDRRITTDTKIIPVRIEKYLREGNDLRESFRLALNDFEGSHAIAMQSNLEPGKIFLALRGSGQSLYIGFCDDQYIFSSEIYGFVEQTPYFIKMDGENERIEGDPATKGQIFVLHEDRGDGLEGIGAFYYDGYPMDISGQRIQKAEITTRDIDRKGYPHFLLKEISEAPLSARKTLRGKYSVSYDRGKPSVIFNLGVEVVPEKLKNAFSRNSIKRIFVVGQGTAAVAGKAIAEALSRYLKGSGIDIKSRTASELSGFYLEEDLRQVLVIAITQSGTTTDTNRAVTMAKERGAHLIAIVNRRQSDITHIADGVFYTSDGRDIEMSVASTKAFYSQIIAGYVLALFISQILKTMSDSSIASELSNLERVPEEMQEVISMKDMIKNSAWEIAKKKKYWAVVGSGPNKVAADEIRIKLSELCYKTISTDIVEDKKHIDLSSEPLIIVCAAGNSEQIVEDIAKDVAIFKAHSAGVVVITDRGETRFDEIADSVIYVPASVYPSSVILNTVVGHIWGYYAACSINEDGNFFRDFRNNLSRQLTAPEKEGDSVFERIANTGIRKLAGEFSSEFGLRRGRGFFSSMSIDVASDVVLLLKYSVGKLPLEDFWEEFEGKRVSSSPFDMLDICLGRAVDELSRPIDTIRHQAKTVTVGTSRKGEIPVGILFDFLKKLGFSLENLTSKGGLTAKRLQKAISDVKGYTLYNIENLDEEGKPQDSSTISIERRDGVSLLMKSRVEKAFSLRGTKRTAVSTGNIYSGAGKSDRAPIVIIPLLGEDHLIRNILLVHVDFRKDLNPMEKREVLGDRFNKISNLINECDLLWDDGYLEKLSIEFLLGEGIGVIAERIIKILRGGLDNEDDIDY